MRKKPLRMLSLALLLCLVMGIIWNKNPQQPFYLTDVTGHLPDLHFSLVADSGKNVTEQTYKGDVVMLYFGFTRCPNECPTTMARLSTLLQKMGSDADKIRVLFVSVDPAHDTPQTLHDYLKSFDAEHMVGLTGKETDIKEMAKRYRAAFEKKSDREVEHSNGIYIFDGEGHARLLASDSNTDSAIIDDLRQLTHAR